MEFGFWFSSSIVQWFNGSIGKGEKSGSG